MSALRSCGPERREPLGHPAVSSGGLSRLPSATVREQSSACATRSGCTRTDGHHRRDPGLESGRDGVSLWFWSRVSDRRSARNPATAGEDLDFGTGTRTSREDRPIRIAVVAVVSRDPLASALVMLRAVLTHMPLQRKSESPPRAASAVWWQATTYRDRRFVKSLQNHRHLTSVRAQQLPPQDQQPGCAASWLGEGNRPTPFVRVKPPHTPGPGIRED